MCTEFCSYILVYTLHSDNDNDNDNGLLQFIMVYSVKFSKSLYTSCYRYLLNNNYNILIILQGHTNSFLAKQN